MKKAGKTYFVRLKMSEKVEHFILVVSFLVLVITGFMGRTPEELVKMLGTAGEKIFFIRGILHRIAGILFIMTFLYVMLFRRKGYRKFTSVIPKLGDFKDLPAEYRYYLGIKDNPPRFNYVNKFKHMVFVIVSIIMSVTGVILWTEDRWSKFFVDVATIVHSMQAIMICLIISLNLIGRSLKEKK